MELKQQLIADQGNKCSKNGYFDSYKLNIYGEQMNDTLRDDFEEGNGNELYGKACAVHSSSMLCYNMLHWVNKDNTLEIDGIKYTSVRFEVKLNTLKGSPAPANLDALLIGKKNGRTQLLFIESKFLEYTYNDKFKLSNRYDDINRWYVPETEAKELKDALKLARQQAHKVYYGYGIKQTITHLFGIIGLKDSFNFKDFKEKYGLSENCIKEVDCHLLNILFKPNTKYSDEIKRYVDYNRNYNTIFNNSDANTTYIDGISLSTMTYGEIFKNMANIDLKEYLYNRYMKYAQRVYTIVPLHSWDETAPYRKYASNWSVFICEEAFKAEITDIGAKFYLLLADNYNTVDITKHEANKQPKDAYGLSMIGVVVDKNGKIADIVSRWNLMDGSETLSVENLLDVTNLQIWFEQNNLQN